VVAYPGQCTPLFRESLGLSPMLSCSALGTVLSSTQKPLEKLKCSGAGLCGLLFLLYKIATCTKTTSVNVNNHFYVNL
jgi:hypothetical protein